MTVYIFNSCYFVRFRPLTFVQVKDEMLADITETTQEAFLQQVSSFYWLSSSSSYIKLKWTRDRLRSSFDFVCSISFVRLILFVRFRLFNFLRSFDFIRSISFVRFRLSYERPCAIAALSSIDGCIVCGNR